MTSTSETGPAQPGAAQSPPAPTGPEQPGSGQPGPGQPGPGQPGPGQPGPGPAKRRRGRESATDMLRSLGVVFAGVALLWFFGQASPSDEKTVRSVDQSEDRTAWTSSVPGARVPGALPGWTPTVSQYDRSPVGLRLGWVTADGRYAELAQSTGPAEPFISAQTGEGTPEGTVDVGGTPWQRYVDADGSVSLVRRLDGGITVVAGTTRENAPEGDVVQLARSLPG